MGRAPEDIAADLVAAGAEVVCVTLGRDGVVVAAVAEPAIRIAGFAVDPVDTTGAAVFANAAAALSTTAAGARGLLPTQARVRNVLNSRSVPQGIRR